MAEHSMIKLLARKAKSIAEDGKREWLESEFVAGSTVSKFDQIARLMENIEHVITEEEDNSKGETSENSMHKDISARSRPNKRPVIIIV